MSYKRNILERIPPHIRELKGYVPGKTIEEVVETYEPERISKLASNENSIVCTKSMVSNSLYHNLFFF